MSTPDDSATAMEEELDLTPVQEILDSFPSKSRRYLIPMLQKVQEVYRYLPEEAIPLLMDELGISKAQIAGVISFYPQLRSTEPGKYIIKLCMGTACFVKGAPIIAEKIHDCYHIHPSETDETKLFTLETASCLGNCGAAPMAIVGEDTHNNIDPEKYLEQLAVYKDQPDEPVETSSE